MGDRFPATFELTMVAMIVAVGIGIPMGSRAARSRDGAFDVGTRLFGVLTYAAPVFWLGILAQLVFSVNLGWLPSGQRLSGTFTASDYDRTGFYVLDGIIAGDPSFVWDVIKHLLLPGITLGLVISGVFIRMVRVNMLQTLRSDYVESARAHLAPAGTARSLGIPTWFYGHEPPNVFCDGIGKYFSNAIREDAHWMRKSCRARSRVRPLAAGRSPVKMP